MIPLTLRLRNFMSYGDDPIVVDFEGLHLACLSGGNGHGKSALLDAITWALWGRSRAKREDDLVRQGATEMEVELCFRVGGNAYRVLRKRSLKAGGGRPALEFQAMADGAFTAITGGSIAETQTRITETLKLGYETFINSTFLLQGRADEFTVKPPSQRKEVLGEILGLDEYDRLAERAREWARSREARATLVRDEIGVKEAELARRPVLRQELGDLARTHDVAVLAVREAESALQAQRARRQSLAAEERNLETQERSIAASRAELARLRQRHDEAVGRIAEADELLAHEASIGAGMAELQAARAAIEEMGARAARAMELQTEVARIRQEIESEAAELRGKVTYAAEQMAHQQRLAAELPALLARIAEHEAAEGRTGALEGERAALAASTQAARTEIGTLEAESARLQAEMVPLRERLKLLNERGANCPVCEKPLGEDERARVVAQYRQDGVAKNQRCKENEARSAVLQREIAEAEAKDRTLAATLANLARMGRELGQLRQLAQTAREAAAQAEEARATGQAARQTLESESYALEARARLAAAEEAMCAIGYDSARYEALRRQAAELAPMEQRAAELATARERRSAAEETRAATEGDLERRRVELAAIEENAALLRQILGELPEVEALLTAAEAALVEARRHAETVDRTATAKRELLRVLDEQEESLRVRRAELAALEHEGGAYAELAQYFGKKGIPAMIIDSALPELERRANEILARMSDGGMQVQFATQAQGSRGDLLETLDIRIADASGTRPYEMFSGGEAFRANFAIRIALSRLLAERAGAQLQMLVIDEGFGTQDSQGRERLTEAINSIAPDFEKIVVVTHIDELKDLFNTRIDVIKDGNGSRVVVTAA